MANTRNKATHYDVFSYWFICHLRGLIFAFAELMRAPVANLMTVIVIAIAITLPCGLYLILQNFETLSYNWNDTPTISLYLKNNLSPQQRNHLQLQLSQNPVISKVNYISAQEGLKEFSQVSQLGQLISTLDHNPLPDVLVITPKKNQRTPQALQQLLNSLKSLPQVTAGKLDLIWVQRLSYIITLSKRSVAALAVIFALGVIFIVGNTIRLHMESHLHEVSVLKLIGATNAFIRRPLLYRGILYGVFGGALAWLFIIVFLYWLAPAATALAKTYHHNLLIKGMNLRSGLKIIGLSLILGLAGAWLALIKHLNYQDEV